MIEVLIPTIGRSHRLADIVKNLDETTHRPFRVQFITEAWDTDTIAEIEGLGLKPIINDRKENYAGAVNTAYDETDGEYLFAGADDLVWYDGWDTEALRYMDGWIAVVGTNDLLNPYVLSGMHSTHHLVARWYLDNIGGVADIGPGSFLPECYDHNYTDTEFIGTAKMRSRFRPCLESIVQHLHVSTGQTPADATHQRSIREYHADSELYDMRRDVWFGLTR